MEMPAGYDAWKTRAPEYWDQDPEEETEEERRASERADFEDWLAQQPISYRARNHWQAFCWWLRWEAWRECTRPFRAVRSWWRGYRKAPWKVDEEIPF